MRYHVAENENESSLDPQFKGGASCEGFNLKKHGIPTKLWPNKQLPLIGCFTALNPFEFGEEQRVKMMLAREPWKMEDDVILALSQKGFSLGEIVHVSFTLLRRCIFGWLGKMLSERRRES